VDVGAGRSKSGDGAGPSPSRADRSTTTIFESTISVVK
jgi:hypothetical protein